jgi:DNA polymerase-3 subunit delta
VGEQGVEHHRAGEATGADAVAACNSLGLLGGEARLVIVDGVSSWRKADVEAIAAYLADPAPDTVLALVADELKSDSALAKVCAKAGQVLTYSVRKRDLPRWVAEQFRLAGVAAEPDACAALIHLVGEDPHALATEVDKLATWADGEPIGEREVEQLVGAMADTPTFALTDAWAARDAARTLEASEEIFERVGKPRRDTAPRLLGALTGHLGRLQRLKRLAAEGVSPRDAAASLRMHPFYAKKVAAQAEGFSGEQLSDATVRLAALDLALKGGSRLAPDLEVQRALIDLVRDPGARPGH